MNILNYGILSQKLPTAAAPSLQIWTAFSGWGTSNYSDWDGYSGNYCTDNQIIVDSNMAWTLVTDAGGRWSTDITSGVGGSWEYVTLTYTPDIVPEHYIMDFKIGTTVMAQCYLDGVPGCV